MDATAAVVKGKEQPFEIGGVSIGEPRPDEVLVKVVACGVCHTDLICRDQWYPVPLPSVFGHEGSGVVEAVGANVTKVAPGDRVAMSCNSCGMCANCLSGSPGYCKQFFESNFSGARIDGSNAYAGEGASSSSRAACGPPRATSTRARYA